ncbi:hypothetical protein ACTVZO_41815 [Streptomyces sp. IBSNAI002]|uniref:hypothetical protein n=1 Tax=Streptomyces sp. IBSNAI002 TaxID=3457500 RepID=UPI003FD4B2DE
MGTKRNCVVDIDTGKASCFGTYRELVATVTGGAVSDAPADARTALSSDSFRAKMESLSKSAVAATPESGNADNRPHSTAGSGLQATAPTKIIIETAYDGVNYDGGSVSFASSTGPCSISQGFELADLRSVSRGADSNWDNRINSFVTFGQCVAQHYTEPKFPSSKGGLLPWTNKMSAKELDGFIGGNPFRDSISSVRWKYRPTDKEALLACDNKTATRCTNNVESSTVDTPNRSIAVSNANCTDIPQQMSVEWEKTEESTVSTGGELTFTFGSDVNFLVFKGTFEASYMQSWGLAWTNSTTFRVNTAQQVSPKSLGMMYYGPKIETVHGTATVDIHGMILHIPYTAKRALETQASIIWTERKLTAAELSNPNLCGTTGITSHRLI